MLNISRPLDRKERFLREIKGSQVIIPDLYELFPGWKFNININYELLKNKQTYGSRGAFLFCLPTAFTLSSLLMSIQLG
jgi:hypothetical protein